MRLPASPAALIPLRNSNTAIHRLWLFFWLLTDNMCGNGCYGY